MSSFGERLPSGGRIDRTRPLQFLIDGRPARGFAGDSLASALLANGMTLIGRSFKYHRPRGFLSAGAEEPNGLFTLGRGARTTPNVMGTLAELHEGLIAARQNAWPSVEFDLQAINSWLAPLLGAGFYYKTFMGPARGSWMFYERFIRRAAGLGRAVYDRDPDRYETSHAYADVLVIGSGPAGLSAALGAARTGARVVLVEQDWALGGSLLASDGNDPNLAWTNQVVEELSRLPNAAIRTRTTAIGIYDGNTVALLERREHLRPDPARGEAREITVILHAKSIVYATGAIERPLLFPNNDRPGIMLATAVRCYLNRFAVSLGRRAVIVTTNDSAYATALTLAHQGTAVTIIDQRSRVEGAVREAAESARIPVFTNRRIANVEGTRHVSAIQAVDNDKARTMRFDCDVLGVSAGWSPTMHLTSHTGVRPVYRDDVDAFVPGAYAAGHFGAGGIEGALTVEECTSAGTEAGRRAARHAGYRAEIADAVPRVRVSGAPQSAVEAAMPPKWLGKVFVDFQNDVTMRDMHIALQEGFASPEHLKRYTTLGMGTDQGRTSNINALQLSARLRGVSVAEAGATTFRPPYTAVSIGALAGRHVGQQFRPIRRSPLHDWHLANGAIMIEAGPWLRAWYYRWAGNSPRTAYVNEMQLVRAGVGLSDISSLGKIDVQGPDTAEFLNRIYVNNFAMLPVGKARYGVMLNDDATVLDDGTTARFSETRYFMTTTTAQAGEVMSRLEFLQQTAWVDLKVQVTSLTDQWAGMSLAGPRSRAVLEVAFPGKLFSDSALPHMGCRELTIDGIPLRILRLSFSGELAFELYVAADYAIDLWEHLLACGRSFGIRPYGLEALASLRIEKGHVAGLELDHRNTLDDLGLGKMVSRDKAYVGRALRDRPDLRSPERWSLVGLESHEMTGPLRGGSILFACDDSIAGHGRGYITSATWSTVLDKYIALALYQGGLAHEGQEVICAYPLRGESVRARIVSPVFIDKRGERLRV